MKFWCLRRGFLSLLFCQFSYNYSNKMKATLCVLSVVSLCLAFASSAVVEDGDFAQPAIFKTYYSSCKALNPKKSGVQTIKIGKDKVDVFCDSTIAGKGWQVIQRRVSSEENFFRNWTTYESGFGDLKGNYFLGLSLLNRLTTQEPQELYIQMVDFNGTAQYAQYSLFTVADKYSNYTLIQLGSYNGTAGESLSYHLGMPFSTFDKDNDRSNINCAAKYFGAWWYNDCMASNLNGAYLNGDFVDPELYGKGISWGMGKGFSYSYKTVTMMVRSKL
ncbi:uncharacterized protein Dana_GF11412 [Drosophila ananassae]|uniref:Fibrinogen C-terminal domain-containing protein n=2 Tax=Drosophila ananassae TaxID=7217 RepID=B3MDA6_DROAN|nr:uncharacterized protein Dana_GF11412 [Drosophila ananassae]